MTTVAGTGHRPDKLLGYSDAAHLRLTRFATDTLRDIAPSSVISGMAIGWDMALARAAIAIGVPLIAAIPFQGQESRWNASQQAEYRFILSHAWRIEHVCEPGYAAWKMQKRNEWMTDNCGALVALWNGSSGGTANCVSYAKAKSVPVINVWTRYETIHSHRT